MNVYFLARSASANKVAVVFFARTQSITGWTIIRELTGFTAVIPKVGRWTFLQKINNIYNFRS